MALPQFATYINPVLTTLQGLGGSARAPEVVEKVAEALAVPDSVREERHANGRTPRFDNQVHWARHYLAGTGYIDRSRRGVWTLSEKGLQSKPLSEPEIRALVDAVQATARGDGAAPPAGTGRVLTAEDEPTESPPDAAPGDYREQVLDVVRQLPPAGFERLCQRLLRESGFEQVTVTGRSGDGGIDGDGLLLVNKFVSFRVLFQCKRYQGSVGSSIVRDFRGAMMGRADKASSSPRARSPQTRRARRAGTALRPSSWSTVSA